MAPYAHLYEVSQKLKYLCVMFNWSGLAVPRPPLKQTYALYGYCIQIVELISFSKRFVFRTTN